MLTEFDEVNQIEKIEKENKENGISSFSEWFGKMDISDEDKKEREELAEKFLLLFLLYFTLVKIDGERNYKEMLRGDYVSIANSFTGEKQTSAFVQDRASEVADFVDEITRKHIEDEYFTSIDRGMVLSANEGNVIGNYREFVKAVKTGKTRKKWITKMDNRVRKTHRQANGQERGIFDMFEVGKAKMRFCCDYLMAGNLPEEIINCRCCTKYF